MENPGPLLLPFLISSFMVFQILSLAGNISRCLLRFEGNGLGNLCSSYTELQGRLRINCNLNICQIKIKKIRLALAFLRK